jgi:hypothetical protein
MDMTKRKMAAIAVMAFLAGALAAELPYMTANATTGADDPANAPQQ